jgi:hypothetical protein
MSSKRLYGLGLSGTRSGIFLRRRAAHAALFFSIPLLLAGCSSGVSSAGDTGSATEKESSPGILGRLMLKSAPVTLPEGTHLMVLLDESVSSAQQRSGDSFAATVSAPIQVDGKTVIPKGARAIGHVVEARASGHLETPARLALRLDSVEVDGKSYALDTATISFTGPNHNKRNLFAIGGGTGAGALIGGLAGGGKGALIGGAVGAGAGTAGAAATGKKDIQLPPESSLSFRLVQPATVQIKS